MKKFLLLFFMLSCIGVNAQNDTIALKNGNVLFGEIKKIRAGVLSMETPFSDSDFSITFSEVIEIKIERMCFLVLTGGRRLTGYVRSEKQGEFVLTLEDGKKESIPIQNIAILNELKGEFWDRFKGNIDFSYNITKANNAKQFNIGGGLSYRGPEWMSSIMISSLNSRQDGANDITRTDIDGDFIRMLPKKLYLLANISYLSNVEQALDSRYALRVGAGRFLAITTKLAWGINVGLNFNLERFSDLTPNRQSTEFYIGSELNMFDIQDLNLYSTISIFPGITESRRWRTDYSINLTWDLPYDFYFKSSLQFNYDNQAAATGSDFDYVFTTGIGWSFD